MTKKLKKLELKEKLVFIAMVGSLFLAPTLLAGCVSMEEEETRVEDIERGTISYGPHERNYFIYTVPKSQLESKKTQARDFGSWRRLRY